MASNTDFHHLGMTITSLVLAVWLLVSPWLISETATPPASWNFQIAGLLAVLLAIIAIIRSDDLAEYGLVVVAVWLVVSPWALDLSALVTRQAVFYGAILGGLAWFGRRSFKPGSSEAT